MPALYLYVIPGLAKQPHPVPWLFLSSATKSGYQLTLKKRVHVGINI